MTFTQLLAASKRTDRNVTLKNMNYEKVFIDNTNIIDHFPYN